MISAYVLIGHDMRITDSFNWRSIICRPQLLVTAAAAQADVLLDTHIN